MDEFERYSKDPAYMAGSLSAVRHALAQVIMHLPETAMRDVVHHARHHAKWLGQQADETQNVERRQFAAGAWDFAERLAENVDACIEEVESGDRNRTIQPFPAAPEALPADER